MDPVKQLLAQHEAAVGFAPNIEEVTTPDLRSKLTTSFLAQSSPWDAVFVTAELGAELGNRGWLTNASVFMDDRVRPEGDLLTRGMGAVEVGENTPPYRGPWVASFSIGTNNSWSRPDWTPTLLPTGTPLPTRGTPSSSTPRQ